MSDQWQAAALGSLGGIALAGLMIGVMHLWERCRGITYGVHASQLPPFVDIGDHDSEEPFDGLGGGP